MREMIFKSFHINSLDLDLVHIGEFGSGLFGNPILTSSRQSVEHMMDVIGVCFAAEWLRKEIWESK